jgi:hypothetical protein
MKLLRILGTVAALALFSTLPARAADIDGKWTAEFDTQVGLQKYTFDLKLADGKLTGTADFERMGEKGKAELKEGKVEGATVSFVEMLEIQGNSLRIEYKGQISGDEIKFVRTVGTFGSEEFVAKRAK